jgi:hypothetical protein
VSERNPAFGLNPLVAGVGASMLERVGHRPDMREQSFVSRSGVTIDDAAYAAHAP